MFNKILLATTASPVCDDAAKVAFDLAKKYNSKLYILHIFGIPARGFSPFIKDVRTGEEEYCDQEYTDWVKEEIKNTYDNQIKEYDNYEIITQAGVPHTEISRIVHKEDIDLIVMGAHTRKEEVGATRFRSVAGSTMQKVAKSARCPVLIISRPCETCFWYFSNIVFGTDFSKASDSAFQFALKVASEIGCKLYIFHAIDLTGIHQCKNIMQKTVEAKIDEAKKMIKARYVSKMNGFDNYEIEIWEGIPYVEILKFARKKEADLIVMAHHTREIDPEKAVLGSTVEQVVLRAACPVASMNRPDSLIRNS